jgi:hypothetical protein
MPSTDNPKPRTTAWRIAFSAVILAWLPSVTVSAQSSGSSFETAYESALLDSVLLYQTLKPLHNSLERAYEQLRQENQALRTEIHFMRLHQRLQADRYETQLRTAASALRKARWKGRLEGFLLGVLIPIP